MSAAFPWRTIPAMLEFNASRFGLRAALLGVDGGVITHGQLHDRAVEVAAWLAEIGIRAGDRVAVALPEGPQLAMMLLATAGIGAAAVPLDSTAPVVSVRPLLARTRPTLMIARVGTEGVSAAEGLGILNAELADVDANEVLNFSLPTPRAVVAGTRKLISGQAAASEDVAFVLHTSGTSALPKRVPLTHANVCSSARSIAEALELTSDDSCLLAMPLLHGHGLVATLLPALAAGGSCLCLNRFDAADVAAQLEGGTHTWFTGVPAMYRALIDQMSGRTARGLRFLRTASAAMPAALMEQIEITFGVPLIQAYGMTEAAGIAANPLPPKSRKPGSAGLPVGAQILILDANCASIESPGVIGDVVIQGPIVTSGYEDEPGINASVFRDGRFLTGDRGWRDADGYLYLCGRAGEVINRGGEKISPAEIDEVLAVHPAILEAAAYSIPHSSLGEDLAAAIVLKGGGQCTEEELRKYLLERLPVGKVPSHIVFVKELPRNATGKVQRNLLAQAMATGESRAAKDSAPETEKEMQVASIFAKVLGLNTPVGRTENFFSLGGDSLSAARVIAHLRRACSKKLTAGDLLRYPTVREMAEALTNTDECAETELIPIRSRGGKAPFFFVYGDLLPGLNFCVDLERAVDETHAIYVAPAPADRDYPNQTSLEATAGKIAKMISAAEPTGPLILSGYCYGGMMASEVARQLRGAGREIPLLIIIDSYPSARRGIRMIRTLAEGASRMIPGVKGKERRMFKVAAAGFNRISFWIRLQGGDKIEFFRRKLRERRAALGARQGVLEANPGAAAPAQPQDPPMALPLQEAVKAFQWEMAGYNPQEYSGSVALFVSEEYESRRRNCGEAWRALGAKVEAQSIPGNHGGCVTSHREYLLEKLRGCL